MGKSETGRQSWSAWGIRGLVLLFVVGGMVVAQTPVTSGTGGAQSTVPATASNPSAPNATPQAASVPPNANGPATPSAVPSETTVTNTLPALGTSVWTKKGVMVLGVRFDGVTFSANDLLMTQMTQKQGQPLDPDKVRADLRRLFASGKYRDISVSAEPVEGGVTLVYAGTARYYVGRIEIDGVKQERLASLLEFATKMDPGTPYTEAQIPVAVDGIKQTLAENGFFEGQVRVVTTKDDVGNQMDATFTVTVGPQARVGVVTVDGKDPGITVSEFRKRGNLNCSWIALKLRMTCRVKVGRETTSTALADVRANYQKHDRLEATVTMQKQTYDANAKGLNYHFGAEQGPVVKVVIKGAKISKSRMHLLVPVFEEGAVDNDLLNEGAFNIRDYLQQQGYFNAQTQVQLLGAGTANVTVEYDINEGDRHKVTAVNLTGNKYFSADLLGDLLRVHKADAYVRNGKYSTQLVNADVDSILALYRANGFSLAKVTSSVKDIDEVNAKKLKVKQIQITFTIVEGAQQKFGDVELGGVDPARESAVKSLLNTQSGQPFSLITLSGDRDAVLSYYISNGFDHAKVEIEQNADPANNATDVTLNVTEGQQVFVDKVLMSGIVHTKPKIVERQLKVKAGQPLDQSALVETQRNLYDLALFNEANVAIQNPTGDAPFKNVLVQLTEAKRWDVTYGFGFEAQTGTPAKAPGSVSYGSGTPAQNGKAGVSPRVSVDVSRINLKGTQDSLTFHGSYGLLEEIATLSFSNPQLLGHRNFTGTVSGGYSNVQDVSTFASKTLQGDVRVTEKVKRADTFIYDFQYRRVSIDENSLEVSPNLIPQLAEPVTVGGPAITFFHDTRDPSPLDAKKGQYYSISEFIASSKFGSSTDFNKIDMSHSSYYTFGKHKYTFARNTRVAFENSYGVNPNAAGATAIGSNSTSCLGDLLQLNPSCLAIPLPERLFAGGATSHRGFGINDAGPRDLTTGYPVGGSAVVVNSFELRLPPPTLPLVGDSISFVIFHDMGNAFQYAGDMFKSIKNFRQPDQAACRNVTAPTAPAGTTQLAYNSTLTGTCNFNYYSHAVGMGLRYNTPVGPIRVDFSYNLNPPIYPVFNDFTGNGPYVGQASHFNFFFSIGQSF